MGFGDGWVGLWVGGEKQLTGAAQQRKSTAKSRKAFAEMCWERHKHLEKSSPKVTEITPKSNENHTQKSPGTAQKARKQPRDAKKRSRRDLR